MSPTYLHVILVLCGMVGGQKSIIGHTGARMLERDQQQVVDPGQTLEISCRFHMVNFDMFDNPVVWKKYQYGEMTTVNIMGNIQPPFVDTKRFNVKFIQSPPRYTLLLTIQDVSQEDYGNYTCEVRATYSQVIASLTHYIMVKVPVDTIVVSGGNRTIRTTDIHRDLDLTESAVTSLRCVSHGGCPLPNIALYMDRQEITTRFTEDVTTELRGKPGLRIVHHTSMRSSDSLRVTADQDNTRLQCIVTVPGLAATIATVRLRVKYAPIVTCPTQTAHIGDKNVYLRCEVRARPPTTQLFWVLDHNHTKLVPGELKQQHWTINMDGERPGVTETRLYIREATPDNFRSYSLVAENSQGSTRHTVKLNVHMVNQYNGYDVSDTQRLDADSSRDQPSTFYHRITSGSQCYNLCIFTIFGDLSVYFLYILFLWK